MTQSSIKNDGPLTRKEDDPRYVPGVSEWDDDSTDREWFEAMGPAPAQDARDEELGPVCEDCLKYLPDSQIATKDPRILCEDCRAADSGPEFTEAQLAKQKELWAGVDEHANRALAVAWDGCHKVYLLMDEGQVKEMQGYGYSEGESALLTRNEASPEEMRSLVHDWFEASCGLRFISAVSTVEDNPNDGFFSLISQDDGWEFFTPNDDEDEA